MNSSAYFWISFAVLLILIVFLDRKFFMLRDTSRLRLDFRRRINIRRRVHILRRFYIPGRLCILSRFHILGRLLILSEFRILWINSARRRRFEIFLFFVFVFCIHLTLFFLQLFNSKFAFRLFDQVWYENFACTCYHGQKIIQPWYIGGAVFDEAQNHIRLNSQKNDQTRNQAVKDPQKPIQPVYTNPGYQASCVIIESREG